MEDFPACEDFSVPDEHWTAYVACAAERWQLKHVQWADAAKAAEILSASGRWRNKFDTMPPPPPPGEALMRISDDLLAPTPNKEAFDEAVERLWEMQNEKIEEAMRQIRKHGRVMLVANGEMLNVIDVTVSPFDLDRVADSVGAFDE